MTHRHEAARGRDIAARWCALAEQRLEHLTEMFETGRWRRFHSEVAFLENIQEAKRAVVTWRALAAGEPVPAAGVTGPGPLGWSPATLAPNLRPRVQTVPPVSAPPLSVQQPVSVQPQPVQPAFVQPRPLPAKPFQPKSIQPAPAWPEPVRPEPFAPKALEPKSLEPKPFEPKPFEPKPVQFKPFQPKSVRIAPAVEVPLDVSPARARFDEFAEAPTVPSAEPEQIVEFTLSLDGIEAKYPLLRNAF
jgi:uncharacterized repeat protein (TIGR03809 family)